MGRRSGPTVKRWTNPATPLQAARFERHWLQAAVAAKVRAVCPGHNGQPCRFRPEKLSDLERGEKTPSLLHIQMLCVVYDTDPETLGLIRWRTSEQRARAEQDLRDRIARELTESEALTERGDLLPRPSAPQPPGSLVPPAAAPEPTAYLLVPVELDAVAALPGRTLELSTLLQSAAPARNGRA